MGNIYCITNTLNSDIQIKYRLDDPPKNLETNLPIYLINVKGSPGYVAVVKHRTHEGPQ